MSRFPTLASLKEQASRLDADRVEYDSDLPKVDAQGLAEVAGHMAEGDQEQIPMMKGWISYLRAKGEAFFDYCVNVDETLEWGASTVVTYSDGTGTEKIGVEHDWIYVPRAGSRVYNPQDTYLHGTSMRFLWSIQSILAHGGLVGEDYDIDNEGTRRPSVEAPGYCSGAYLGNGYWFQVMVCVDRAIVDPHPGTTKELGSSLKQTRIAVFCEICGIAFRPFRVKTDNARPHATSASSVMHG